MLLQNGQSHLLCSVILHVVLFACRMMFDISTWNRVTKFPPKSYVINLEVKRRDSDVKNINLAAALFFIQYLFLY